MLIPRIYKELKKLNTKGENNPMDKWANELNRQLSNEGVQMVTNTLAIREMQIKTTLDSITPQSEWLTSRKQTKTPKILVRMLGKSTPCSNQVKEPA
jgi:hypothetical protein